MKLNNSQLRKYLKQIINEEYNNLLKEVTSLSTKSFVPIGAPLPRIELPSSEFSDVDTEYDKLPDIKGRPTYDESGLENILIPTTSDYVAPEEEPADVDIEDITPAGVDPEDFKVSVPDEGHDEHDYGKSKEWVQIASSKSVHVRNPNRSYGTKAKARFIEGLAQVAGGNWYIGDLSKKGGGKLTGHISHQTGIDGDYSLPTTGGGMAIHEKDNGKWKFKSVKPKGLDLDRTLQFLTYAAPRAKYVFLDRSFHKPLKKRAKKLVKDGIISQGVYNKLFGGSGIIRHEEHHKNHFHVRLNVAGINDPRGRGKVA